MSVDLNPYTDYERLGFLIEITNDSVCVCGRKIVGQWHEDADLAFEINIPATDSPYSQIRIFWQIKVKTPLLRCREAERVGFEPTEPFSSLAFQASALGQTTLPLHLVLLLT